MPPNADGIADYLNYWMRLQQENRVLKEMNDHWIGQTPADRGAERGRSSGANGFGTAGHAAI